ncbi:MAG: LLM class flavin-dependent oxidoreductase, partial [Actinomycetota bacterium]
MKLGWHIGYWGRSMPAGVPATLSMIEGLGYDSVFTAESWGSDAISPLAWWGAGTTRLRLCTNIVQISARTPAATAMAAITMDHLSGGRFCLGLGVSGPQVVEGWYGQRFNKPLARTREYVEIIRQIVRRDRPVEHHGEFYDMPHKGGSNLGKP